MRLTPTFKNNFQNTENKNKRSLLINLLNNSFSVFKQYYTHFYTLFHSYVFHKTTNNNIQTSLPNGPSFSLGILSKHKILFL